jgi:hypothetical protein
MYRFIRSLSIPVLLAASFAASAQTPAQTTFGTSNPALRGTTTSFGTGGMASHSPTTTVTSTTLAANPLSRGVSGSGMVTPVPEPSEWSMLMVGLAFVGWVVHRKTRQ